MSATTSNRTDQLPGFHVLVKPIGPICNLDCEYCYYLEKENLYSDAIDWKMSPETLESFTQQYIESQSTSEIAFGWQGGEPTMLGIDFFRKAIEFQKKYANGKKITNSLQTNGTLLDNEWCKFLSDNDFLVGLSLDGPAELHDYYRKGKKGEPTHYRVMKALELLQRNETEFNTLTCVNTKTGSHPLEIYRFLKQAGVKYMQFIPLVDRLPDREAKKLGLKYDIPPTLGGENHSAPITPWSVGSRQYGEFLCAIFDEWVKSDVGNYFVQSFDTALGKWVGSPAGLCVTQRTCGRSLALEHNGDLYSCDHFVYPGYFLGNTNETPLPEMVNSERQKKFGNDKRDKLPQYCQKCEYLFACNGRCPKDRFISTPDGGKNLNYLCEGMKLFLSHIDPFMEEMTKLIQNNQPVTKIMDNPPD